MNYCEEEICLVFCELVFISYYRIYYNSSFNLALDLLMIYFCIICKRLSCVERRCSYWILWG